MTTPRLQAIEPQLAELSPEEMRELAAELTQRAEPAEYVPKPVDWEKHQGLLENGPDPLEYQREVRAEWDERDRQLQAIWKGTSDAG